ncbi:F-box/kelch-repeat protein At3g06240-like [Quercus robur]|uniref:F-box/kelch-repeat protein At3g06240-like n=1 Tax=Quercus robur TaxID=38942 RepID=UPI002162CD3F|nr:F-box/kelch-repeat protein At3g06240-like [Quercus robur]
MTLLHFYGNPSIRKAIFLPTPEFPFSYMPMQYYGFGYDPTTDDYILVRVLYLEEEEGDDLKNDQLMVQIYTLGTGTWRNVTNPGPGSLSAFPENHLSVFVNGAVHWIASIEDDYIIYVILSFDRRNNSFHEMALPGSLDDVNKLNIKVAVHDGSLRFFKSALTCCSLWVMKEFSVAESWTKLYDIDVGVTIWQVLQRLVRF